VGTSFETLGAARDCVASAWLRKFMEAAGIAGEPTIWFASHD
jgi:LPS sulfotransferase NodH